MSELIDLLEAEGEAENVIGQNGFTALPICPFAIAQKAEILVAPKDSTEPGVSGFLMRVGNAFGIRCAHIKSEGFVRFTVAHELNPKPNENRGFLPGYFSGFHSGLGLGHYFLPGHPEHLFPNGDGLHCSRSGFISHDRYEKQADTFASALLMPEKLFRTALGRAGQGFPAIEALASLCKTSITATAIRFTKYTDDPVAVIVSSKDRVEYCFMSDTLKDVRGLQWLKKGDLIAPRSATATFNKSPANVSEAKQDEGCSWLDDWFDGAPQIEMNEDVVGLGSYGKTLTVLFTEEAVEEEEEEDD